MGSGVGLGADPGALFNGSNSAVKRVPAPDGGVLQETIRNREIVIAVKYFRKFFLFIFFAYDA